MAEIYLLAFCFQYGMMWGPFGPVVDGDVLAAKPSEIREDERYKDNILTIPIIAGVCRDEGAFLAENASRGIVGLRLSDGLDPNAFRRILEQLIRPRAGVRNQEEVVGAMEFEYTFWAKPDNKSAVRQNLIDVSQFHDVIECPMPSVS